MQGRHMHGLRSEVKEETVHSGVFVVSITITREQISNVKERQAPAEERNLQRSMTSRYSILLPVSALCVLPCLLIVHTSLHYVSPSQSILTPMSIKNLLVVICCFTALVSG